MKSINQVRSNRKSTSRRSQAENPSPARRGGLPAPAAERNPGEKPKLETVQVYVPRAWLPSIDAARRVEGLSRPQFVAQAVYRVLPALEKTQSEKFVPIGLSLRADFVECLDGFAARKQMDRGQVLVQLAMTGIGQRQSFLSTGDNYYLPVVQG